MTYIEYIEELVAEFLKKKSETQQICDALLANKAYLDREKSADYLQRVNDCHQLANQAEYLMYALLDGLISPFETID
jgi:hypothetical protein